MRAESCRRALALHGLPPDLRARLLAHLIYNLVLAVRPEQAEQQLREAREAVEATRDSAERCRPRRVADIKSPGRLEEGMHGPQRILDAGAVAKEDRPDRTRRHPVIVGDCIAVTRVLITACRRWSSPCTCPLERARDYFGNLESSRK